jgi:hypothetical protein
MKRKFFKNIAEKRSRAIDEVKQEIKPVFNNRYSKFKSAASRYPQRTLGIMFAIVGLNFLLFLYMNRKAGSAYSVKDFYSGKVVKEVFPDKREPTRVPFTIANFIQMKSIKDSLEYYLGVEHKTREDTLLLLRLFKKYEAIDTSFKTEKYFTNEGH